MLERIVIAPSVFGPLPDDEYARRLHCNCVLGMLYDLLLSGVLIIDENNDLLVGYANAMSSWPEKFKKKLLVILSELQKRHRFIQLKNNPSPNLCGHKLHCSSLDLGDTNVSTLFGDSCSICTKSHLTGIREFTDISEYSLASVHKRLRSRVSLILSNGEVDQVKFEQEVLIPLFRDAKHLKIYDRYIGRSMKKRNSISLSTRYSMSLDWIISLFLRISRDCAARIVEVYGGVQTGRCSQADLRQMKAELLLFENQIFNASGFRIKTYLKEELDYRNMLHARYIVTDQATILLDKGVDLLWGDDEMVRAGLDPVVDCRRISDVTVASCHDATQVVGSATSLRCL